MGGGQLGRMFVQAAQTMGFKTVVLCADSDEPAAQIANDVLLGSYTDEALLMELAHRCHARHLGDRDLEGTPELGDHGPDQAALLLERPDLAQEDVELEGTHEHDGLLGVTTSVRRAASRASRRSR